MSLKEIELRLDYDKNNNNIAEEFYIPCLSHSQIYDRLTGYFSSSVFSISWEGMKCFIKNNGVFRIITSYTLLKADFLALSEGYEARLDDLAVETLKNEIGTLLDDPQLAKPTRLLACLAGLNIAHFKIALINPGKQLSIERMFHDKVGIFRDIDGNAIAFRGSMNESYMGLASDGNIESISVYKSWDDNNDAIRVNNSVKNFECLWRNEVAGISVFDFSVLLNETVKERYPDDNWDDLLHDIISESIKEKKWHINNGSVTIRPYEHQLEALKNWEINERTGIFEHATGSGKTITALCAINDSLARGEVILILVPSIDLLNQWHKEIRRILSTNIRILICGGNNELWKEKNSLESWTKQDGNNKRIILATISTATRESFLNRVYSGDHIFLVVDEVHRVGSPVAQAILGLKVGPKLGLSATPYRFGDQSGTNAIFNYFKRIIPPSFTIGDAIIKGVLTKYIYTPHIVKLTNDEQKDWTEITRLINRFIAQHADSNPDIMSEEYLKNLLINRARIIKNAENKIPLALDVMKKHHKNGQKWIVYCDNQTQMNSVLDVLSQSGYNAYEYHSSMEGDRTETLKYFRSNGGIIVSIKCLDEGVDIPDTTHALILASSQNPREFIQRRGRILRKHEGKHYSFLHDAIVLPKEQSSDFSLSFISNELVRSWQFGIYADNQDCLSRLQLIANQYGIELKQNDFGGFEDE
ncbi:MAG: DEAD/DEAH box helicase family protein [Clostridiales bacterium]|nr:DEAD/DEAH box helicase family protein [Clostridiales bacterium]